MLPPKSDPGYEERLKLLSNVRDKWDPRTKDSTAIPESMRYNGSISTWPLPILRGISALASDTPGDDAWNQVYDLLEEGQKKRMDDESNILPAQIQLSDLEYARKHYVQEKPIDLESGEGERRFVRKDEYENDTGFAAGENDDLASQSGNAPGSVSNTKANKDNPQNPQSDITILEHEDGSDSFPPRILPNDTDAIRFQKYNLWIQHYWNVNDCKDLISEDMFPRDSKQNPMRGSKLENHGGMRKGELLELLYELARITGPSRRDAAWAKIREKWNARPPGKNGNKTLSIGDVRYAINYFQSQDQGARKLSTAAPRAMAPAAPQSDMAHDQDKLGGQADQAGDKVNEDVGGDLQTGNKQNRGLAEDKGLPKEMKAAETGPCYGSKE